MDLSSARGGSRRAAGSLELAILLKAARCIVVGQLEIVTPQGVLHRLEGRERGPRARLVVHRPGGLRRVWSRGDTGFAEAFMAGDVDSPDLDALLELGALNERHLSDVLGENWLFRLMTRALRLVRGNSRRGARRNVRAHYDLGNAFYRLWLDDTMTYSSAIFEHPRQSLAAAQEEKNERLIRLVDPKPGDHLLEIGSGWGGFALQAAGRTGCRVTGLTLSTEQLAHARTLARARGLDSRVRFRLQDYRDVDGQFDHIVSIEMFEAVGEAYWESYFSTLADRLRPGGTAALHAITIDPAVFPDYRRGCDFIQRYIFPGGMLAPPETIRRLAARHGLVSAHEAFLGAHYARTLEHWHQRFLRCSDAVEALGFDRRFQRMWRYYLSYCRAGFVTGRVDLMQVLLRKPGEVRS